ncbi:hypothetical protein C2E23DRAFT_574452 [Lenzites betulinus]|nr:hypothetical protein C2E23DRAFT_574452 [Lenzites betulinus]
MDGIFPMLSPVFFLLAGKGCRGIVVGHMRLEGLRLVIIKPNDGGRYTMALPYSSVNNAFPGDEVFMTSIAQEAAELAIQLGHID